MVMDYETLRLIWWALLGVLLMGFAAMDGFDLGVAAQLGLVAHTDIERRVAINTIGPVWEGNQVWFILGGGAIFAAWPPLYAVSFSGFYLAMFVVLASLILRPVGFKFRSKIAAPRWHAVWDAALQISGIVPALVFGVAVGNAMQGVAFSYDQDLRAHVDVAFFSLFNPFALLCGVLSLAMLTMHGSAWLCLKAEGVVAARARGVGRWASVATLILFAVGGLATVFLVQGYKITSVIDPNGPSDPTTKTVVRETGAWLANYHAHPWMLTAPALGIFGAALALVLFASKRPQFAFFASAASVMGIVATAGVSMFPFLLPSSSAMASSLTVWDASSSRFTLLTMLIATVIILPVVLVYTALVYRVLRGRVTEAGIARDPHGSY
jgi:cytochrome d ubiquinol oxidase subunit II